MIGAQLLMSHMGVKIDASGPWDSSTSWIGGHVNRGTGLGLIE